MAVSGPERRRLRQHRGGALSDLQSGDGQERRPLLPARPLGRGQVSVISQSGGLGFAFFDRGRPAQSVVSLHRDHRQRSLPRNVRFRRLHARRRQDRRLPAADRGRERRRDKFERVAEKALRAGKPLIVGKIGQSEAGSRAVRSHTAALAGAQAAYRALFERYGVIEGRDIDEMVDIAQRLPGLRLPAAGRQRASASARRRAARASGWRTPASLPGSRCPVLDDTATRTAIDVHLPLLRHVAKPGRPHRPGRAQARAMPNSRVSSPARPRSTASSW